MARLSLDWALTGTAHSTLKFSQLPRNKRSLIEWSLNMEHRSSAHDVVTFATIVKKLEYWFLHQSLVNVTICCNPRVLSNQNVQTAPSLDPKTCVQTWDSGDLPITRPRVGSHLAYFYDTSAPVLSVTVLNATLLHQERYKFTKMEKCNDLGKNLTFWFICSVVSR